MSFQVLRKPQGKGRISEVFYVRYKMPWMLREKWKCLGVKTKEAAEAAGVKLRRELELEHAGFLPAKAARGCAVQASE